MKEAEIQQRPPTRMKYFVCDRTGAHQGEFLNLICVESGCSSKGLICSICRAEDHEKHRVLPLKMFIEEINKQNTAAGIGQLGEILQSLHNNKAEALALLRETVRKMAESIRKVEENVMNYYASIQRQILSKVKLTEDLNSIVGRLVGGEYDNDKNAKNDLLRVVDSVKVQSSKPKEAELTIDIDFAAYLSEATAMNVRLATEIEKLKQSIADFSGVSESICRSTLIKKSGGAHCFSKENKAPEIELSSNQTEAKKITHNLPRLVLCESPLRNGLNKSVFKIKKHSNLIAIGVGLQSKIKERSFCFDGSLLGHGTYLVASDGMVYSNSEADENSVKKGFSFDTNDVIEVEHLSRSDKLILRKQNSEAKVQLRLSIPTTQEGKVYYCALLGGIGDFIELIS